MEERTIVDADGVEVFTRWAIDHPRAVVLVSRSRALGSQDRFADALNDARIAAVALDHRVPNEPGRRPVSWARAEAGPSSSRSGAACRWSS